MTAARLTMLGMLAVLSLLIPGQALSEPAYPAYSFTDSIGVNTNLAIPNSAYYNLGGKDRDAWNIVGKSAAPKVQSLLADLGVKHIRYDFCDEKVSPNCVRGNATARMLHQTLGIKDLDDYFSSAGNAPALLNLPGTIASEVNSSLAVAADPANAPVIEALEGSNEPDSKKITDWAAKIAHAQLAAETALAPGNKYASLGDRTLLPAPLSAATATTTSLVRWAGNALFGGWNSAALDAANMHAYFYTACPEAGLGGTDMMVDGRVTCQSRYGPTDCKGGPPAWLNCANQTVGTTKPIWITETGYTTSLNSLAGMSLKASGIYLPRLLLEGWRRQAQLGRGFARTYVFELLDSRHGVQCALPYNCPYDRDAGHGLVTASYVLKPQFLALKNLLAELADPAAANAPVPAAVQAAVKVTPDDQDTVRHLLFRKSDGSYALAIWRPVSVWNLATQLPPWYRFHRGSDIPEGTAPNTPQDVTVTLPAGSSPVTVYRPSNSAAPVETQAAAATHTITAHSDVTILTFK